jgi:hypothetical protein
LKGNFQFPTGYYLAKANFLYDVLMCRGGLGQGKKIKAVSEGHEIVCLLIQPLN